LKLSEIIRIVEGTVLTHQVDLEITITTAAGCDLMSDVLAFSKPYSLLLTGLTNLHVIRTAEMADLAAIIFVRGKLATDEVIEFAERKGMPLVSSPYSMFELCGRLHGAGLKSCYDPSVLGTASSGESTLAADSTDLQGPGTHL
jgi:predicted transcriptional regulator